MPPRKRSLRNRKVHPAKLVKDHRSYTLDEVMRDYVKCRNTVSNWVKEGLPVEYDDGEPIFRGLALNTFHLNRALARKHPCDGANLYCVRCKGPHLPIGMVCNLRDEEGVTFKVLSWTCSGCGRPATCFGYSRVLTRLSAAGVALNPSDKNGDS